MTSCEHKNLVLIKKPEGRLRCRHCYLTISDEELESDFCPECWETNGVRRRDFEKIVEKDRDTDSYRCEECGILVEPE